MKLLHLSLLFLGCAAAALAADVSAPKGTTITIYDAGFGLVTEQRAATFSGAEGLFVARGVPARLDPASVAIDAAGGEGRLELGELRFEHDLASSGSLFSRALGRLVQVRSGGTLREGTLAGAPDWDEGGGRPLVLAQADGGLLSFPAAAGVQEVLFPGARAAGFPEPALVWRARSDREGPRNIRLHYLARGLSWEGAYDVRLSDDGATARFQARVAMHNASGGAFRDARIKLVLTEQGDVPAAPLLGGTARPYDPTATPPQRYAYGARDPSEEQGIANLSPVEVYEVPRNVTLGEGDTVHVQLAAVERLPVTRFYVYDGVRFDRFQRNRRNDWNYGTEYHETVDTHLQFENTTPSGLGFALPPGRVSLYREAAGGVVDLLGSERIQGVPAGGQGHIRLGPARGLRGERERTGYSEVKPLHEYEESFEIRLANDTDETVTVRVVEHLYRWRDYEMVKSDLEYKETAPQVIEFQPELKPGGRRSIHYTVRYRW